MARTRFADEGWQIVKDYSFQLTMYGKKKSSTN